MLVRKFLKCKIKPEAQEIIDMLENMLDFEIEVLLTEEQRKIIISSLYQTERTWEYEM